MWLLVYIIYSFKLYVLPTSTWFKNWIALVIIICKGYMYDHNYRLTDCKGSTVEYGVEHSEVTNIPKFCLSRHLKTNKHFSMTCFCVNGLYGKILTKKEPIRMLRFTSSLPCHIIRFDILNPFLKISLKILVPVS